MTGHQQAHHETQIPDPELRTERFPIPTWYFVLVVVRLGHRFLVVQERKHGQRWYLPAGWVEPGDDIAQAAQREAYKEAGIHVAADGIVRIEYVLQENATARVRVIVVAHPIDDTPPKKTPDEDSLAAKWVTLEELEELPLRGQVVRDLFQHVAGGGIVYPLALLTSEGAAFK